MAAERDPDKVSKGETLINTCNILGTAAIVTNGNSVESLR